eukprot:sb/3465226/
MDSVVRLLAALSAVPTRPPTPCKTGIILVTSIISLSLSLTVHQIYPLYRWFYNKLTLVSVCDGCPAILLDQLFSLNNTVQGVKAGVIASTNLPQFNQLQEDAQDVLDTLPDEGDISDLVRKTRKLKDRGSDVRDEADDLVPASQDHFADASDLARAAAGKAGNVTELEKELERIKEELENFNLDPDVADNDALDRAKELLAEMKDRDVSAEPAIKALDRAQAANDSVTAQVPVLPTLEPLPERVRNAGTDVEKLRENVEQVGDDVGMLNNKLPALAEEEGKVEQKEGRLKKRIMDIKGSIPPLQDDLDDLSEALNSFPQLDPSPLAVIVAVIVEDETQALEDLPPRAKARNFDCSALKDLEAPEESSTIKDMLDFARGVEKLGNVTADINTEEMERTVGVASTVRVLA